MEVSRTLEDIEREVILHRYRFYAYNKTKTAQSLGIAIRTLDNKLAKYESKSVAEPDKKAV